MQRGEIIDLRTFELQRGLGALCECQPRGGSDVSQHGTGRHHHRTKTASALPACTLPIPAVRRSNQPDSYRLNPALLRRDNNSSITVSRLAGVDCVGFASRHLEMSNKACSAFTLMARLLCREVISAKRVTSYICHCLLCSTFSMEWVSSYKQLFKIRFSVRVSPITLREPVSLAYALRSCSKTLITPQAKPPTEWIWRDRPLRLVVTSSVATFMHCGNDIGATCEHPVSWLTGSDWLMLWQPPGAGLCAIRVFP